VGGLCQSVLPSEEMKSRVEKEFANPSFPLSTHQAAFQEQVQTGQQQNREGGISVNEPLSVGEHRHWLAEFRRALGNLIRKTGPENVIFT